MKKKVANHKFTSLEEVINKIDKKLGKRPGMPKGLPKGDWTKQSLRILNERYLGRDAKGKVIETPEMMCWRVAWEVASSEVLWGKGKREVKKLAEEYYKILVAREFLPNSPTLMNAGIKNGMQYSACFVLPVDDSLVGIFDAIKYQALIHQTGGGTGFSFSRLRPEGSIVKSSGGTASGPVSFMRIFDAATNEIKQGGKRRGANMGILRVDHPDILKFIHCKKDGRITNFNISVAITDKFMKAYRKNKKYDLIDPKYGKKAGKLSARKVFKEIQEAAWKTGDPGVVFIDRRNKGTSNPVPKLGPIEATNPCGEQELYPFDACNLGSIFLPRFIKATNGKVAVDWEKLERVVKISVGFLDSVIEVNPYPLEQIRNTVLSIRRIGLGIGGWADMLAELGIAYDSEEALKLAGKLMKFIQNTAEEKSIDLAKERGVFPLWSESIFKKGKRRRNSTVTTIAPTGSISIIAGFSSGIEPLYAIAYRHVVKDEKLDREMTFINPSFEKIAEKRGVWSEDIKKKVLDKGILADIDEIPDDIKKAFITAHEIKYPWHIKMQAAFQRYTENAVSKTVNLKNGATSKDVGKAYLLAWDTGCKGVTVFRDGCRDKQVLNVGTNKNGKAEETSGTTLDRPLRVVGATYKLSTPVGSAFVTINQTQNGEPLELFVNVGKAGSDVTAMAEALGRTISTALRFKGHLKPRERAEEIAIQLAGIGGRRSVGFGPNKILSLPDAVAAALSIHFSFKINGFNKSTAARQANGINGELIQASEKLDIKYDDKVTKTTSSRIILDPASSSDIAPASLTKETIVTSTDLCPSCGGGTLVYEEGCSKCYSCGHSEC